MPKQIIDDHRLPNERQGSVTLLGSMVRYGSHDLPDPSGVAENSLDRQPFSKSHCRL